MSDLPHVLRRRGHSSCYRGRWRPRFRRSGPGPDRRPGSGGQVGLDRVSSLCDGGRAAPGRADRGGGARLASAVLRMQGDHDAGGAGGRLSSTNACHLSSMSCGRARSGSAAGWVDTRIGRGIACGCGVGCRLPKALRGQARFALRAARMPRAPAGRAALPKAIYATTPRTTRKWGACRRRGVAGVWSVCGGPVSEHCPAHGFCFGVCGG